MPDFKSTLVAPTRDYELTDDINSQRTMSTKKLEHWIPIAFH